MYQWLAGIFEWRKITNDERKSKIFAVSESIIVEKTYLCYSYKEFIVWVYVKLRFVFYGSKKSIVTISKPYHHKSWYETVCTIIIFYTFPASARPPWTFYRIGKQLDKQLFVVDSTDWLLSSKRDFWRNDLSSTLPGTKEKKTLREWLFWKKNFSMPCYVHRHHSW